MILKLLKERKVSSRVSKSTNHVSKSGETEELSNVSRKLLQHRSTEANCFHKAERWSQEGTTQQGEHISMQFDTTRCLNGDHAASKLKSLAGFFLFFYVAGQRLLCEL